MMTFFPWKRVLRSKTVWFFLLVMLALGLVAVLAHWLAPHDPYKMSISQSGLPPMWVKDAPFRGMAEFPLGTDRYGRDVLSRLIYGTRTAFLLALFSVALAALIGTTVGLIASYSGNNVDAGIMLFTEIVQALPTIMFVVIIVLIFRSLLTPSWSHGMITLVIGFAAVAWVSLARLIRVNLLRIKSQLFVEAAVALGASPGYIITKHLLPNVQHVILVWIINTIPTVILLEAMLGYLGIGVTAAVDGGEFTVVSWGGMFFSGRPALRSNPFMLVIPSLGILLISVSFIMLSDFLRGLTRQEQQ